MSDADPHPTTQLDDLVHQRARLGILAVLVESGRAEFTYLRDALDLTDGNLSRHLKVLAGEGLLAVEKAFVDHRPRTWLSITPAGEVAIHEQLAAMKALIARVEGAAPAR